MVNSMVEWKKLGDISEIGTGSNNREDCSENGLYPFFVRSKDILRIDKYLYDEEAILIPGEGGVGEIFHYINGKYGLHQRTYRVHPFSSDIKGKYLYYYLQENFRNYIHHKSYKSTAASIRRPMLTEFPLAIPPLSEQSRIVSILDTFTASIDNLKKQIAERRKQYEYERDQLLDLEGKEGVEMKKLGEVCTFSQGIQVPVEQQILEKKEGYCRFLRIIDFTQGEEPPRYVPISDKNYYIDVDDIAMVRYGSPGFVCVGKRGIIANNLFKVNIINSDFVTKLFLACLLKSKLFQKQIKQKSLGGALQAISFGLLRNIILPFPPLSPQSRIVSILDTFEASIANLEAQLKLREKQYEYYRNQLLTFE